VRKTKSTSPDVKALIERARREGAKELDLSRYVLGQPLLEIPAEIFDLTQLESLDLSSNDIREVPERIKNLAHLKRLRVLRNPIEKLPDIPGLGLHWDTYLQHRESLSSRHIVELWIEVDLAQPRYRKSAGGWQHLHELAHMPNLRWLYVGLSGMSGSTKIPEPMGELRDLINNIRQLSSLESLRFWGLLIKKFPDGIRELKSLRHLELHGTGLREIPDWLGELDELQSLGLGMNELTALPNSLANLHKLEGLYLSDNRFTNIPEVAFRIKNLSRLSVSCNGWRGYEGHIKQVPADILQLPGLELLDISGQPVELPPEEVVKEGVEAIKNYWRQRRDVGIDYLAEAKLIVLGEAGAGKTSLAKKIENPEYQLKPQEDSTEGIDVLRWSFPSAVRVKREEGEEMLPTDFKVNIWDFGGQEIYHATHQFFLTRRSLYLLVADDRKEDTDFNYWLQVVELLSDGSPLLIVQNEKQDRQRDIDLGSLRARFPGLGQSFRVNLADNRGLEDLTRAVRQGLERLPHIGTPLPKTWAAVRAALEGDERDYIGLEDYLAVCREHGFQRREDMLQLSGYLHDLGICLHFQDDPVLKHTVILKPKWGTDAVYRVLDDREVLNRRGRFGPADLARIWADEKYAAMRHELLRLMMRFQLCYQLPEAEAYIAPQMLSPTRPAYEWEHAGALVVRYDYEFMPKGIVTRFIVALNHLIEDQSLVWKSGVVLAREGARAEVIEDYARRQITVRVGGADKRGLLAIADDQLERIHASFPRLRYDKYLPCNCEVCRTREEPFAYPLSELKDFAMQDDKIQCRVSRKLVDAAALISDVLPSAVPDDVHLLRQLSAIGEKLYSRPTRLGAEATPPPAKEVFVSYAWSDASRAVVDKLEAAFAGRDITLIRDRNEMRYKDSIRDFMRRIGRGKCVVVVLSKKYLESKSCMFELTEIAGRGDIRDRVFPIVLDDANVYDALGRIRYIKHWEQKREELDAEMKSVGGENLQGIREELDLFAKIRGTLAGIVDILGDMNALTAEQHEGAGFDALLKALEARLSE
jgi:internalin A